MLINIYTSLRDMYNLLTLIIYLLKSISSELSYMVDNVIESSLIYYNKRTIIDGGINKYRKFERHLYIDCNFFFLFSFFIQFTGR